MTMIINIPCPPQIRELRVEVDELQSSRVQEDVISRTESRVKELENVLRTEERWVKAPMIQYSAM